MPHPVPAQQQGLPSAPGHNQTLSQPRQLPLPVRFDGANGPNQTECWIRWSRRFERYRIASCLQTKPEYEQVSTLLYAMGDCADDILAALRLEQSGAARNSSQSWALLMIAWPCWVKAEYSRN